LHTFSKQPLKNSTNKTKETTKMKTTGVTKTRDKAKLTCSIVCPSLKVDSLPLT